MTLWISSSIGRIFRSTSTRYRLSSTLSISSSLLWLVSRTTNRGRWNGATLTSRIYTTTWRSWASLASPTYHRRRLRRSSLARISRHLFASLRWTLRCSRSCGTVMTANTFRHGVTDCAKSKDFASERLIRSRRTRVPRQKAVHIRRIDATRNLIYNPKKYHHEVLLWRWNLQANGTQLQVTTCSKVLIFLDGVVEMMIPWLALRCQHDFFMTEKAESLFFLSFSSLLFKSLACISTLVTTVFSLRFVMVS